MTRGPTLFRPVCLITGAVDTEEVTVAAGGRRPGLGFEPERDPLHSSPRVQIPPLALRPRCRSRPRRLLTAARGRRSHGPGDLGPPLARLEALPSVAPRVARAGLAGHSVPRSTGSRRLTSLASRQARGGILNQRETRFARLPGFKSHRSVSRSLSLAQTSQGRDSNPRTPDYKSGACTAQAPLARSSVIGRPL